MLSSTDEKKRGPGEIVNRNRDKVWLEATNLHLHYLSRKLSPKQQGPFEISQVLSPLMYCLQLPPMWKIHDVFHATLLSPYKETTTHGPNFSSPPPVMIGPEEEYEVDKIVSHKGPPGQQKYLTAWKGYPSSENTWEPESNLRHAKKLLTDYKTTHRINLLHTCLSPPHPTHLPNSSHLVTSPGSSASPCTSSNSFISIISPLNMPSPIPASVPLRAAPSTTKSRKQSLFVSTPLVYETGLGTPHLLCNNRIPLDSGPHLILHL